MITSQNLGLKLWNLTTDPYDHAQLAENLGKIDQHDHTPGRGLPITTSAIEDGAVTSEKLDSSIAAVPLDGSVTDSKVAVGAGIVRSKLDFGAGLINADISAAASISESKLNLASDAAAGTPSRRTLGTGANQALPGNHVSVTNARTPTNHAATHATGGGDAVTLAQSQITGLTTALGNKANTAGDTFTGAVDINSGGLQVTGGIDLTSGATTLGGSFQASGNSNLLNGLNVFGEESTFQGGTFAVYPQIDGDASSPSRLKVTETGVSFHRVPPIVRPTIDADKTDLTSTGALAQLLRKLDDYGLIVNSST